MPTSSSLAATHSAAGRSGWVGFEVLMRISSLSSRLAGMLWEVGCPLTVRVTAMP